MTDEILKELWNTKDNIAKEHAYDIDKLAAYFQFKSKSRAEAAALEKSNNNAEHELSLLVP